MAYDVFVSSKTLDEEGSLTRDSEIATEVFNFLSQQGLSVFLSTVSLEALGSSAYKKAIDAALDSAAVLVAVGTSADHINSKWVRYEWDSFFNDILSGIKPKGRVFTYIEDFDPKALPRALRQTQTFSHSGDSLQRLFNFITRGLPPRDGGPELVPPPTPSIPPAATVFISYAREDGAHAQRIVAELKAAGLSVYDPRIRALSSGDHLDRDLIEQIVRCTFFVPIISEQTERQVEGSFRREWDWASNRADALHPDVPFILPVILGSLRSPRWIPRTFEAVEWTRIDHVGIPGFIAYLQHQAQRLESLRRW